MHMVSISLLYDQLEFALLCSSLCSQNKTEIYLGYLDSTFLFCYAVVSYTHIHVLCTYVVYVHAIFTSICM